MKSTLNIKETKKRKCSYCGAVEGKPRPLGRFMVELRPIGDKLACQSCIVHHNDEYPNRELKKSWFEKVSRFFEKRK